MSMSTRVATRWERIQRAKGAALDAGVLDPDEVREVEGWNPRAAGVRSGDRRKEATSGS